VLFGFGLWNVLLLPFAVGTPPNGLGGTEFQYGLQEGLTSLGFVFGSLLMAKYIDRLPEGTWMVISFTVMGAVGILYGLASNIYVAILLVTISGFAQPPSSIARALVLQRNTPREYRGRVFAAFFVSRDVLFLLGMATAGLADIIDIRLLIVFASSLVLLGAVIAQLSPGLGRPAAEWRRSIQLLRTAPTATGATAIVRPATILDFDKLAIRLPALALLEEKRPGRLRLEGDGPRSRHRNPDRPPGRRQRRRVLHSSKARSSRGRRTRTARTGRSRPWARVTSSARSPP
jgi:MFS family permease